MIHGKQEESGTDVLKGRSNAEVLDGVGLSNRDLNVPHDSCHRAGGERGRQIGGPLLEMESGTQV